MLDKTILKEKQIKGKKVKPLFTKSRILFLIIIFIVISIPLLYRQLDFLLK